MTDNAQSIRVLVAEDDDLLLQLLEHKLIQQGYAVTCVEDGEHALDAARADKPDLIVLDGMMPGMDGFDVLRNLKEGDDTRDIPVVMLTARVMERDIVNGLTLGAEEYLVKPFMPEELVVRIKRLIDSKVRK
ncbi:MAG: response regulator [Rhodospirillales bacterium]|nr:response regulator [Rhodospirillales bacterium]